MAGRTDFSRVLKEKRMNFRQFVDLNATSFRVQIQGNASKIFALPAATARTRERLDGTLMHFERLRPSGKAAAQSAMRSAEGAAAQSALRE